MLIQPTRGEAVLRHNVVPLVAKSWGQHLLIEDESLSEDLFHFSTKAIPKLHQPLPVGLFLWNYGVGADDIDLEFGVFERAP